MSMMKAVAEKTIAQCNEVMMGKAGPEIIKSVKTKLKESLLTARVKNSMITITSIHGDTSYEFTTKFPIEENSLGDVEKLMVDFINNHKKFSSGKLR